MDLYYIVHPKEPPIDDTSSTMPELYKLLDYNFSSFTSRIMLVSVIKHWIVLEFGFFDDGGDCKVVHREAFTFTFP